MSLRFNIVYTPGTVKYLSPLVFSLLKWCDCSFRLVANGCAPQELKWLKDLCERDPRLEMMWLPFPNTIKHGQVLTFLQKREESDTFCFLDSDILAVDEFVPELSLNCSHPHALFSAPPLWCKPEEQMWPIDDHRLRGWYNTTPSGRCLGGSYFAIYDNSALTSCIKSTGVDFSRYSSADIPNQHIPIGQEQTLLDPFMMQNLVYDTGKLLNLLLQQDGYKLFNITMPPLLHLGGISFHSINAKSEQRNLESIRKRLYEELSEQRAAQLFALYRRRAVTMSYFLRLFQSCFEDKPLPPLPRRIDDSHLMNELEIATRNLVKHYDEFRAWYR